MTREQASEAAREMREMARRLRSQSITIPAPLRRRSRILADQAEDLARAYEEELT